MSEILEKAVEAIKDKMAGAAFDSSVKFKIEDQGSIVVDSDGVRVSDEETDCTLIASLDVFKGVDIMVHVSQDDRASIINNPIPNDKLARVSNRPIH